MMGENDETVITLEVIIRIGRGTPTPELRTHILNKIINAGTRALDPLKERGYIRGVSWTTTHPSSPDSFADLHPGDVKTGNPLIREGS